MPFLPIHILFTLFQNYHHFEELEEEENLLRKRRRELSLLASTRQPSNQAVKVGLKVRQWRMKREKNPLLFRTISSSGASYKMSAAASSASGGNNNGLEWLQFSTIASSKMELSLSFFSRSSSETRSRCTHHDGSIEWVKEYAHPFYLFLFHPSSSHCNSNLSCLTFFWVFFRVVSSSIVSALQISYWSV